MVVVAAWTEASSAVLLLWFNVVLGGCPVFRWRFLLLSLCSVIDFVFRVFFIEFYLGGEVHLVLWPSLFVLFFLLRGLSPSCASLA